MNRRFRILLIGAPSCGKSQAIVDIARLNPGVQVVAFDRQDGITPLIDEPLSNLTLHVIRGEPIDAWPEFRALVKEARAVSDETSWICFDLAGDWYVMAQAWYVKYRYDMDLADYLAARAISEAKNPLAYGGLSTEDWSVIRPQYYTTIPQTLGASCSANVLVTAHVKDVVSYMQNGQMVYRESKALMPIYKQEGIKPDAERDLTSQVNTVVQVYHPTEKIWKLRGLGKRGEWGTFDWEDVTNRSVVEVLKEKANG